MEVSFASRKMQKTCSSEKEMKREWGAVLAKKLQQRLMELKAAETLEDISRLPPARCHELTGNRKGQLSVDVTQPYRLIFAPDHDPAPRKPDGGLDWTKVTKVVVLEVVDTHG
jgi:proteic killer suppression protein